MIRGIQDEQAVRRFYKQITGKGLMTWNRMPVYGHNIAKELDAWDEEQQVPKKREAKTFSLGFVLKGSCHQ